MKRKTILTTLIAILAISVLVFESCKKDDDVNTNNPPNKPSNPSPANNAIDILVNSSISWTCTDPDGNALDYDIYFGTSNNPEKVEESYTSTTYELDSLLENTTYYWYIKAYEVGNKNSHSESEHWQFKTVDGPNTPPIALFTVSPSSGPSSTDFAFDATGSTDNEDPTSDLQVRWDFDGNGSWDTDWDYNKTINHKYSIEAIYIAKLEVKDTKELTNQFTNNITVNNSLGTFTDPRDGKTYITIDIGSQTWFAENLNYETPDSWWYDNNEANGEIYGRLYKWEAAMTACPSGWHLPTDDEWKTLEIELGMSQSQADTTGWRGTDEGEKMKSTNGWDGYNGTNSSGFNGLGGGWLFTGETFNDVTERGYWWSSSEYLSSAWVRRLASYYELVSRRRESKTRGFSVRCIKD